MNFDFTPPQPDFTTPEKEADQSPSAQTPPAQPIKPAETEDWIAAALPSQALPPQAAAQSTSQTTAYQPIPTFSAAPVAPMPQQQGDGTGGLIPYKNPLALIGYYVSVFGLIPCAGLVLGPAAIVLGVMGHKFAKANPYAKGVAHAWVAIVLGSIELLAHLAFLAFMFGAGH